MTMIKRLAWDEYFLEICAAVALRATCDRGRSGALLTLNNHIICSGYAGAPAGFPHCDVAGHLLQQVRHPDGHVSEHCVRTVHAEQNALIQALSLGVAVKGATVYCSMTPCRSCALLLISAGIRRVVCRKIYQESSTSLELFQQVGVEVVHCEPVVADYSGKTS